VVEYCGDSNTEADDYQIEKYLAKMSPAPGMRSVATQIKLAPPSKQAEWAKLDEWLVSDDQAGADTVGSRMRFVLIPVEPPRGGAMGQTPVRELSDEERHIDGIQKLTQLWQRSRYVTAGDQQQQASLVRSNLPAAAVDRDPNPLAIEYQTRDPSAVVNAYGPLLTSETHGGEHMAHLFPESEMYHSSTFDVSKLVKQMQEPPPQGVELRDRRWFARLHLRCFRGDEMVNWLLPVFKDLHTREDAVAVGNELMKRGIFSHVRHKHEFRDGNYFYQITSSYRTTAYPDTASMFNKSSLKSVPSTPMTETRNSPMLRPANDGSPTMQSTQADSDSSGKQTPTVAPTGKRQVMLSQMMLYDIDPSKKSDHVEVVRLHYDRIHNPENAYHIQIEWLATTSKLVRDAVNRWTALVESHGLRLVQLPLGEACKISDYHPFDQPIPVELALRPPDKAMSTPVLSAHSHTLPTLSDPVAYQKALLRKFGFVLDFEAAASFTSKLDITYSYGRPEYDMTQFVHKSGLLLAQIGSEKSDFLLLPNRLATQRPTVSGKPSEMKPVEEIVKDFVSLCRDANALKAFYEEVSMADVAPFSPQMPLTSAADSDVPPIHLPPHLSHRAAMRDI